MQALLAETFQSKKNPLRVMALLERYPTFSNKHLNDLIIICDVFECLKFLYPNLSAKAVLKEAECLLSQIDRKNLSGQLLLEMLTEPQDHKGDNFKVKFKRDQDRNLIAPLEIIAIDNDDAMGNVINAKHLILVKSLLFANQTLLNEPIAEKVRERCLLMHPKAVIMQWLEVLNNYYEPYHALKESGIIFKGLSRTLRLEEQVSLGFIERLLERLEMIKNSLKQGMMTHKRLWEQVEPLLAYSYQALSQDYPGSQPLMTALYNKKKPLCLENILAADLEHVLENGETLGSLIKTLSQPKTVAYRSYLEMLTYHVENSLTPSHPLQLQALALCLRLKFYHINLPPEGLVLSPATFIKAYIQSPQKWIQLIKSCPKVSIQFKTPILLTHPSILYYAISETEGPLLVEALLAFGAAIHQIRFEDGLTPLHFAAAFYPDCIPVLVAFGAQTECTEASGLTPLEMAMHLNQHKAIILLLKAGAGQNLKADLGLVFIKAYQTLCSDLCQSLLSRNIGMAWTLALSCRPEA